MYFYTPTVLIGNLGEHYKQNIVAELLKSVEEKAIEGSGFSLSRIVELNTQISSYEPFRGSSYLPIPKKLQGKRAIINIQNSCFKWAILSYLFDDKLSNPQRPAQYEKLEHNLNFDDIKFPMSIKDITKFEQQNKEYSINVYRYNDSNGQIFPLRVCSEVKKHHVHLLLLVDYGCADVSQAFSTVDKIKVAFDNPQIKTHYCWIKNLGALVSSQLSGHQHRTFICDRFLNYFQSAELLKKMYKNVKFGTVWCV